jgi:hypothetical protein
MAEGMNMLKNLLSEGLRNEGAESGGRNVTEEFKGGRKGNGGNTERWKSLEERNSGTPLLLLSNL